MSKRNVTNNAKKEKMDKKYSKEEKKHIHVVLGSNRIEKFDFLKKRLEQNSDVDLIRYCLDKVYDTVDSEPLALREVFTKQIDFILQNEFFKNRHLINSVNDIINDAVFQWIQSRKQELSLYNLELRNELQEQEKTVVLALIENQSNYTKGMTIEDIIEHTEEITKLHLNTILKKFEDNKLVNHDIIQGTDYYYIPMS